MNRFFKDFLFGTVCAAAISIALGSCKLALADDPSLGFDARCKVDYTTLTWCALKNTSTPCPGSLTCTYHTTSGGFSDWCECN
jgi:hypothetical protein